MIEQEEDWENEKYEEDEEPLGYYCMSCGNVQAHPGFALTCDRCNGPLDEYYG
jgi:hypothetical protein